LAAPNTHKPTTRTCPEEIAAVYAIISRTALRNVALGTRTVSIASRPISSTGHA
jgi:hypothetical protein